MNKEFAIAAIENIPNVVFVKEAKNFNYVYVNKAFETVMGMSAEVILGKSDSDLMPPELAHNCLETDLKVLKENITVQSYDDEIDTAKGRRIFNTRKLPLPSPSGEIEYILGISEDITEKRTSERQIEQLVFERGARAEAGADAGSGRCRRAQSQRVPDAAVAHAAPGHTGPAARHGHRRQASRRARGSRADPAATRTVRLGRRAGAGPR